MRDIISKLVKIWSVILITLLLPSVSQGAIQASIALNNNMVITPAPLDPLELNGEGSDTFSIVENLGGTVPEITIFNDPSTVLIINFANLTNKDVSLISSPMLDYYTPVYDAANDTLYFVISQQIFQC